MAHKCTVTRRDGKYHLECEECGLITAQPANRGGLIARGERHERSGGAQGGPTGSKPAVVLTPRERERQKTDRNIREMYGMLNPDTVVPTSLPMELALNDSATLEPAAVKPFKRAAFQQAVLDNECMKCHGPLKNEAGGFCTTPYPVLAVCNTCKGAS